VEPEFVAAAEVIELKDVSCFEKYLMLDPLKSRLAAFIDFIFVCAFITELILVPYTYAQGFKRTLNDTKEVEFAIDVLFAIQILLRFVTGYVDDNGQTVTTFKDISIHYLK